MCVSAHDSTCALWDYTTQQAHSCQRIQKRMAEIAKDYTLNGLYVVRRQSMQKNSHPRYRRRGLGQGRRVGGPAAQPARHRAPEGLHRE